MIKKIVFYWPGKKIHKDMVTYRLNEAQEFENPTIRYGGFGFVFFTKTTVYHIKLTGCFLRFANINDLQITVFGGKEWQLLTRNGWATLNEKGGKIAISLKQEPPK